VKGNGAERVLAEAERQAIFAGLVEAQDRGDVSVSQSRKQTAERVGVSERQVFGVEREGIEAGWPPLDG
jgi:hypothetical protein